MAGHSRFHTANTLTNGRLAAALAEWHANGLYLREQEELLASEFGLNVPRETIRRWQEVYVAPALEAS